MPKMMKKLKFQMTASRQEMLRHPLRRLAKFRALISLALVLVLALAADT